MEAIIDKFNKILSNLNVRSLLVNGNVEKQLKYLLASGHDDGNQWYLMDKKIDGHEIDLILLNHDEVVSVAELKCTFVCDTKRSVIYDAIEKAEKTNKLLHGDRKDYVSVNEEMSQYIMHFLLLGDPRVVDNYSRPQWISNKYPHPTGYTSEMGQALASEVVEIYKDAVVGHKIDHLKIIPGALDLVLVKLEKYIN